MFYGLYKNKKVLVTGHTGFKGSWLCAWLNELGADVYGLALAPNTSPAHFDLLKMKDKIHHSIIDIKDRSSLKTLIKEINPEIIFHLAANAIVKDCYDNPVEAFETNTIGSLNILNSLNDVKDLKAVVMITSDKCYENVEWEYGYREDDKLGGKDPYSASKACAEIIFHSMFRTYFKQAPFQIASARAGNVIGGGDWANNRIIPDCVRAWHQDQSVEIRNPNATRPWQHVLEPLSGYLLLGAELYRKKLNNLNGESFNFGPGSEVNQSVSKLIDEMKKFWQKAKWHADSKENFGKSEANLLKLCCDKAYHRMNWVANLDFASTIEMTANWYNNFYTDKNSNIWDLTISQIHKYEQMAKSKKLQWTRDE